MDKEKSCKYSEEEIKRAAYALNMCTVSISQIVDYNDVYILEQEYEAILNNLNLEKMPKDEALLNILVELLNTITFFRIQEKRKDMIEKQYQERIKNAIWSAVPNLGVIVSGGGPVAIAYSLATQVGVGYMNYRKEKARIRSDKEKDEMELQITALEQFNALRRELFTTAWRLADEYKFEDKYRLTERQIKQYNEILMDQDEVRKYERLEAIQDKFEAYPPFWYFIGHTANYIATSHLEEFDQETKAYYQTKAREHFVKFESLNTFNLLREDQMSSAFALEYIDLLLLDKEPDYVKINQLLKMAVEMAGNANDVLEMCAIAYLKIGNLQETSKLLKILVNENYNAVSNAKLLSRIYTSMYINEKDKEKRAEIAALYTTLTTRVTSPNVLFPLPKNIVEEDDHLLQENYINEQKRILKREYRSTINAFMKKYVILFNKHFPVPKSKSGVLDTYFADTKEAKEKRYQDIEEALEGTYREEYLLALRQMGFKFKCLEDLDKTMTALEELKLYTNCEKKVALERLVTNRILKLLPDMHSVQAHIESQEFDMSDYEKLQNELSYQGFMEDFFDRLKTCLMKEIESMTDLKAIDEAEYNLVQFCKQEELPNPLSEVEDSNNIGEVQSSNRFYYLLKNEWINEEIRQEKIKRMCEMISKASKEMIRQEQDVTILMRDSSEFEQYFKNTQLNANTIKSNVIAIIDDRSKKDSDFLFTMDGFILVEKNRVGTLHDYSEVKYSKKGNYEELKITFFESYSNEGIDIGVLYQVIEELYKICKN